MRRSRWKKREYEDLEDSHCETCIEMLVGCHNKFITLDGVYIEN